MASPAVSKIYHDNCDIDDAHVDDAHVDNVHVDGHVDAEAHLYEYVEADVEVSTVDKLVSEKSPNLFLLRRVEDQGALLGENSYHIKNQFCHIPKRIILRFDVAKNQLETLIV